MERIAATSATVHRTHAFYRCDSFVRLDTRRSRLPRWAGQSRGDTTTASIRPASPARCEKNRSLLQREQYSLIDM